MFLQVFVLVLNFLFMSLLLKFFSRMGFRKSEATYNLLDSILNTRKKSQINVQNDIMLFYTEGQIACKLREKIVTWFI